MSQYKGIPSIHNSNYANFADVKLNTSEASWAEYMPTSISWIGHFVPQDQLWCRCG